ncbi:MAG: DUF3617 family protein [Betaproteobacteria bacterium]|nr:DUF3617 family protein [Betaproteobacteria bacterium]
MNAPSRLSPSRSSRLLAVAALLACVAPLHATAADAFPKLRAGKWEFTRLSVDAPAGTQPVAVTECLDPAQAMRDQNAMLEKVGCKFSEPKVSGNVYTYEAICNIPNVGPSRSRSVLTRKSDSAYTVAVESEAIKDGKPMRTRERLTAKRIGDCTKQDEKN